MCPVWQEKNDIFGSRHYAQDSLRKGSRHLAARAVPAPGTRVPKRLPDRPNDRDGPKMRGKRTLQQNCRYRRNTCPNAAARQVRMPGAANAGFGAGRPACGEVARHCRSGGLRSNGRNAQTPRTARTWCKQQRVRRRDCVQTEKTVAARRSDFRSQARRTPAGGRAPGSRGRAHARRTRRGNRRRGEARPGA